MPEQSAPIELGFPTKGLDEQFGLNGQQQLTTPSCQNVRAYDPGSGRSRGGQRAGLTRHLSAQFNGSNPIQDLGHVTTAQAAPSATDITVRTVTPYVVSGGTVGTYSPSSFTTATAGSAALSATVPAIFSAPLFQVVYFADGINYKKWTASTNTVSAWAATAGTIPANGANKPRLIELWRSRICVSGVIGDEHNWFFSCAGDATNWDYGQYFSPTMAIAGNNSDAGKVGDVINTMIPWSDELMIFGCDHSIWVMQGDPAAGGSLVEVSDITGMAWGRPWCKDPSGLVYFLGSRGGVYRMSPKGTPERISKPIEERFADLDLTNIIVKMVWNDRDQGVNVFLTPLDGSATTHYFYDARMGSWWPDVFADVAFNPVSVDVFDGDAPGDRAILLGCRDSRIRKWDNSGTADDTSAIASNVYVGPLRAGSMKSVLVNELQGTMATGSSDVAYDVYAGETVQAATAATVAKYSGTWSAGRNFSDRTRQHGDAIFVKLSNVADNETWAFESLHAEVKAHGPERQRLRI